MQLRVKSLFTPTMAEIFKVRSLFSDGKFSLLIEFVTFQIQIYLFSRCHIIYFTLSRVMSRYVVSSAVVLLLVHLIIFNYDKVN